MAGLLAIAGGKSGPMIDGVLTGTAVNVDIADRVAEASGMSLP